jgi:serine/threonine-protein kinase
MQDGTEGAAFAGRTVGSYAIGEQVGAGGMGEVYRAHDTRLDRQVAVKVLPSRLGGDAQARDRFVRETRLASKIVHPYVATVFDVVEDGDDLFLVMEYLEGRTLRQVLHEDRPRVERAVEIAIEVTEALEAIHAAGVIHRDLKPGNVMIAPSGHVKVMDFGVARFTEPSRRPDDHTLTREGLGVGTVLYMSPEQVRGRDVDARSDLFALGGLLWEVISGEHPFARDNVVETAGAILREPPGGGTEPPSLTQSGPLRDVVLRLLQKNPDARYPSAAEVLDDLRAVARGDRPSHTDHIARMARQRTLRTTALTFAAGVVLTATVVAAVMLSPWTRQGDGPPPVPTDGARPLVVVLPLAEAPRPARRRPTTVRCRRA